MLLYPLFFTSFVVDDFFADHDDFGDRRPSCSRARRARPPSAWRSSPTGGAAGWSASRRRPTGDFVDDLGVYDDGRRLRRDRATRRPATRCTSTSPATPTCGTPSTPRYGRPARATHGRSAAPTGTTRPTRPPARCPGPAPEFFFAPTQIAKRTTDWGREELDRRIGEAWAAYSDVDRRLARDRSGRRRGRGRRRLGRPGRRSHRPPPRHRRPRCPRTLARSTPSPHRPGHLRTRRNRSAPPTAASPDATATAPPCSTRSSSCSPRATSTRVPSTSPAAPASRPARSTATSTTARRCCARRSTTTSTASSRCTSSTPSARARSTRGIADVRRPPGPPLRDHRRHRAAPPACARTPTRSSASSSSSPVAALREQIEKQFAPRARRDAGPHPAATRRRARRAVRARVARPLPRPPRASPRPRPRRCSSTRSTPCSRPTLTWRRTPTDRHERTTTMAGTAEPGYGTPNWDLVKRWLHAARRGGRPVLGAQPHEVPARSPSYADGNATGVRGKEADDAYAPLGPLAAIGAIVAFHGDVLDQRAGDPRGTASASCATRPAPRSSRCSSATTSRTSTCTRRPAWSSRS